ncbi:MAG TPA: FkbM family methyltransferase [Rhizobium sp.]
MSEGITADDVVASIEMILGWTPDKALVDYHLRLGFQDRKALGQYMMQTDEFRQKMRVHQRQPMFLGDRVMGFTHRGEIIYLIPNDLDLTPHILDHGMHEPSTEKVIVNAIRPGDTTIDIGCNVGYHTMAMAAAVGPHGKVFGFEANPAIFPLLKSTLVINQFTTFRGTGRVDLFLNAVADKPGMITLENAPGHSGSGHVVNDNPSSDMGPEYSLRVEVPAVRLDDVLADSKPIDFIHMDIEGAEPLAMKGAIEIINRSPNLKIVSEWSVGMMRTLADVDAYIGLLVENDFRFWRVGDHGKLIAENVNDLTALPHCDLFISRNDPPSL